MTDGVSEATRQVERALLGAILIESTRGTRQAIDEVSLVLTTHDFSDQRHAGIYQAMLQCSSPPHEINVARQMRDMKTLKAGVCADLGYMVAGVPCSVDYMDYARVVREYSLSRQGRPLVKDISL